MEFELTPAQQEWREEIRVFLTANFRPVTDRHEPEAPLTEEEWEFRARVMERGWHGINLPVEYGGLGRSAVDRLILIQEFGHAGARHLDITLTSVAPTIARYGTEENKRDWLPPMVKGDVYVALGYSEPDAGTDLASLRTRAVLEGDEWVINGQKAWNSAAHMCTHEWLAARTDLEAKKHHGISVFMVPIDAEGIEIRPLRTWADQQTNLTFFNDVRVPRRNLIGELNQGWTYITAALEFERVALGVMSSELRRNFERFVAHCAGPRADGTRLIEDPGVSARLAELEVDLVVAELFAWRTASLIDAGTPIAGEASVQKVFGTELRSKLADYAMEILGPEGRLAAGDAYAPVEGLAEASYRDAPKLRFGGGANEVMRDIIAQRRWRMPRG